MLTLIVALTLAFITIIMIHNHTIPFHGQTLMTMTAILITINIWNLHPFMFATHSFNLVYHFPQLIIL